MDKSFTIGGALLLQPNQKIQAQIIQEQILIDSQIFKDRFDNLIVQMPDGKNFYLNKPGASLQDLHKLLHKYYLTYQVIVLLLKKLEQIY